MLDLVYGRWIAEGASIPRSIHFTKQVFLASDLYKDEEGVFLPIPYFSRQPHTRQSLNKLLETRSCFRLVYPKLMHIPFRVIELLRLPVVAKRKLIT